MATGRDNQGAAAPAVTFWTLLALVVVGLTLMIAVPLAGR